jgi:hypothetical protein
MASLNELVAQAVARMEMDGISGWGMNNPDKSIFDEIIVGPVTGCNSSTCNCNSHGSASATYKYVPKNGKLIDLGQDGGGDSWSNFYALVDGDEVVVFIEAIGDRAYHDFARIVDTVPDWCLARLAKEQRNA